MTGTQIVNLRSYDVPIQGLRFGMAERGVESFFLIEREKPMRALNSSMWGGGFTEARRLMNRQVPKSYMSDDPLGEMEAFLHANGMDIDGTAALLTAADLADHGFNYMRLSEDLAVCSWVTAGLGNKARAGLARDETALYPGTINTIVAVQGRLTDSAFVNAVMTATEAKCAALQDMGVYVDGDKLAATGTTTDAVLIAATQEGELSRYAGISTRVGYAIARTVYEATKASVARYQLRNPLV